MKYRKIPVVIEAIKFTESNIKEVLAFMGEISSIDYIPQCKAEEEAFYNYCEKCKKEGVLTHTLEGDIKLKIGEYLIKGVKGEFYPCKADIFKMTYEKVD